MKIIGFDYLCQIRDTYTNVVLASCQEKRMKKELVLHTLHAAKGRWNLPTEVIFHSDRGSQYTSQAVKEQISSYSWKQSFSQLGTPGDNASKRGNHPLAFLSHKRSCPPSYI